MKDCRCDIYDPKDEKENKIYRYALGKSGKKMIICIALNPSSATDKEPDRKLTLKDSIINMDDALGALVVAKIPVVEHLHLDKLMPAIFAWCGYRAGQSN